MTEKILFVNSCVRKESRTLALAQSVLDKLCGKLYEINLEQEHLEPINGEMLEKRERLISENDFSDDMFRSAKEFAAADTIVIAAPYWDLTFPALLKIYLEQITVCGITFEYRNGVPHSLCSAKRLIYITTAGGPVYYNFGFDYVKTLSEKFFSIPETLCFMADGLDIRNADTRQIMEDAKNKVSESLG